MTTLLIAEHDNQTLSPSTLHALTAATEIGGDIHLLVAGSGCGGVAEAAAQVPGIAKVLLADNPVYDKALAENLAALVVELAAGYSHILAPAGTTGKDLMPRVAALLDVGQLSEIIAVESADTFKRPIYAGNAIATVKSNDAIKVITVRGSAFDATGATGGSAAVETLDSVCNAGTARFVSEEMVQSDRPELTNARVIISGGRGMG
ncbi:electron transfer flavoprotein subunit alpha/FixB family protein, partial [Marinobacterium lacunae]|uniref:electron transfer flavoprotein subunit alpha/FixB family protein n=1 Tax=Marinobacterium lacunae TaxID=1232683 RepID=UPI0005640B87